MFAIHSDAAHRRGSGPCHPSVSYYLRSKSIGEWLAYPPKLTVELGSYVDGEAYGCLPAGTWSGHDAPRPTARQNKLGQGNHMAAEPTHRPHHPHRSPTPRRA